MSHIFIQHREMLRNPWRSPGRPPSARTGSPLSGDQTPFGEGDASTIEPYFQRSETSEGTQGRVRDWIFSLTYRRSESFRPLTTSKPRDVIGAYRWLNHIFIGSQVLILEPHFDGRLQKHEPYFTDQRAMFCGATPDVRATFCRVMSHTNDEQRPENKGDSGGQL